MVDYDLVMTAIESISQVPHLEFLFMPQLSPYSHFAESMLVFGIVLFWSSEYFDCKVL